MVVICSEIMSMFVSVFHVEHLINTYIMAIINAIGVGRAKKSMGNVTYRSVRGRTIGSQKRVTGEQGAITRGMGGNLRKPLFAMINLFMAEHASDIQVSFNKSKYGSQRNYFFTHNYAGLSAALMALASNASITGVLPTLEAIDEAIATYAAANPMSIYRVRLDGFQTVYMTGPWDSEDNPISGGATDGLGTGKVRTTFGLSGSYDAPAAFSLNFHAGAKIVRDAGTVHITGAAVPAGITAGTISYLKAGGSAVEVTVTDVVSAAGSLTYEAPALTEAQGIVAVKIASVYTRLSSAYVKTEDDPLG